MSYKKEKKRKERIVVFFSLCLLCVFGGIEGLSHCPPKLLLTEGEVHDPLVCLFVIFFLYFFFFIIKKFNRGKGGVSKSLSSLP